MPPVVVQRGALPRAVLAKAREKQSAFLFTECSEHRRVTTDKRSDGRVRIVVGLRNLSSERVFVGGAGQQNTYHVLDALLPGIRRFRRGDQLGDVTGEINSQPFGFVGYCEIRWARN